MTINNNYTIKLLISYPSGVLLMTVLMATNIFPLITLKRKSYADLELLRWFVNNLDAVFFTCPNYKQKNRILIVIGLNA